MDVLFLEEIVFRLPVGPWNQCSIAPSREEVLRQAMALVGIELIDYDSFTMVPTRYRDLHGEALICEITAYSAAFRERTERAAAYR